MTITLYTDPISPFSRSVELVADLLKINLSKKFVDLKNGGQLSEDYVKLNPRHLVPFIVDSNVSIGESRAIAIYLINKYARGNKIYNINDPETCAKIDEVLYYEASEYSVKQKDFLIGLLQGAVLDPKKEEAYKKVLEYLESRVKNHKFLVGDNYTLADLFLANDLTVAIAVEYNIDAYPSLRKYYEHISKSIPGFEKLANPAIKSLREYRDKNQKK